MQSLSRPWAWGRPLQALASHEELAAPLPDPAGPWMPRAVQADHTYSVCRFERETEASTPPLIWLS